MNPDQVIQDIVIGTVTNGLYSFLSFAGQRISDRIVGKDMLQKWEHDKAALEPILRDSLATLADSVEWEGLPQIEVLCLFLRSPEVQAITRQLYSADLVI